jgi:GNAT superfamily N-acetyltransferase
MVTIRDAQMSDAPAIAGLVTQLGYPTTPADMTERLTRLLADPRQVISVADVSGTLVGMAGACLEHGIELNGVYGRITAVVVDAAARGRGIGAFLVHQLEGWCRDHGADRMTLTSGNHRPDSHQFYDAIGYERTGLRFVKRL